MPFGEYAREFFALTNKKAVLGLASSRVVVI